VATTAAGKKKTGRRSTIDRQLFIRHYIALNRNAQQAWIAAGGSPNGARQNGYKLLQEPEVAAALAEFTASRLQQADITAERVLLELGRLAFFDARRLIGQDGKPLGLHELDEDTAAALAAEVSGEGKVRAARVRSQDKAAALQLLARHFKIVGSELDETVGKALAFAERLGRGRERVRQMRKS
jgi:phage terminase small subunit